MPDIVVFLGAGATKACGGPLTSQILPLILKNKNTEMMSSIPVTPQRLDLLEQFLTDLFHVTGASADELYPGLSLLISLVDMALDRRQTFHPNWDAPKLADLRQAIELGIFDILEEKLFRAPTNNHWQLLHSVYGTTREPCVISTNYDLIIDTAMISFSQHRFPPDGRLPDYRCDIRTLFYASKANRFGHLLKLHGSLNWLYCKTCHRLEIGASESQRFLSVLGKLVGPSLEQSYGADGAQCASCKTILRPLLIAPTHMKDYRNPHLSQVWYDAERMLREAQRVVFIGYSLPYDDLEVVYLLKRSLAHLDPAQITVVEYDLSNPPIACHSVGRRYRTLFGDGVDWHPEGLDQWLVTTPLVA